jgi:hypothetical protein
MKTIALILALCTSIFANGQCLTIGQPNAPKVAGTGNRLLDNDLQIEATRLENTFGIRSEIQFLNDWQSPNAYADPSEGTVYLGVHLLESELGDSQGGPTAIVGIEAHEFAHILQGAHGTRLVGRNLELQADFMAGWYLARQYKHRALKPREFARSLYDKGDWNFYSPGHHGTPRQRVAAMLAGYKSADLSVEQALEKGERFVLALN